MRFMFEMPMLFVRLLFRSVCLALAQIWANKVRSILTTLGIIIGVASITAVIAALTGLKAKVMADLETFGTNQIIIFPLQPDTGPKKNASPRMIQFTPELFEGLLEHCPSVVRFTRVSGRDTPVRYRERSLENVMVRGIDSAWHTLESRPVLVGRPFSYVDEMQGRMVCLIDPELRDKLQMNRDPVGEFITIGTYTFRVVGVVERRLSLPMLGGDGTGEGFEVFIPFKTYYKIQGEVGYGVTASSRSAEVSEEAKAEISFYLRQARKLKPDEPDTFGVETVESYVRTFKRMANRFTMVAGGVVGISLIVGGIGIMNIMLVSVSERTREIGLRKAVGARNSAILTQFLVEAVVLCCIGGLFGVALGHMLTVVISRIPGANLDQAFIPAWAILMSFGFSTTVGIFFGMFPAVKAAQLDPIEALRHE
jgi:putative ABC transport system permease protein